MNKKISLSLTIVLALVLASCQLNFGLPGVASATETPTLEPTANLIQPTLAPSVVVSGSVILQDENTLISLFQQVSPGVVAIQTLTAEGGALGSGFVYDKEGHIITNYHVVEGATDVEVDFTSGFKIRGNVIATDMDSDLAVIKVDAPAEELFPLPLGDSDQVQVGQFVIAIGNPFGLSNTMTMGIVSAKGRSLDSMRSTAAGGTFSAGDIIQTDAAINPGNSGGPLLNLRGEVIGINRAIRTTTTTASGEPANSGIGFAISSKIVQRVVPVLIETGIYEYPYLGITSRSKLSLMEAEAIGLTRSSGAYVIEVTSGGPADLAGVHGADRQSSILGLPAGGDLILAIDGRPVQVFADVVGYLMASKSPGDTTVLTILRGTEQLEITVTLDKRP
ncbi:MAG TPA: trypsin-like peptidase domain-containing protein [Anaerolineaceae bacterium]|nr:trypsin-like peptidase domain-containing protein [Anaerolineaceae bacterium]